jgi:hypothetical protein
MRLLAYKSQNAALLADYWMGHENREMATRYAKQFVEEVAWRKQWAKKVGLDFKLSDLVHPKKPQRRLILGRPFTVVAGPRLRVSPRVLRDMVSRNWHAGFQKTQGD